MPAELQRLHRQLPRERVLIMRCVNHTSLIHRGIVATLSLTMLLGTVVLGAEPPTASEFVTVGEEPRAVVAHETQACAADVGLYGLPVVFVTSSERPNEALGCPADGSICFDSDLCRAQCRACGIEIGVCIWGLCRCLDT